MVMLIDNERCNTLMKLIRNFWQLRFEYVQEEMCARNVCVSSLYRSLHMDCTLGMRNVKRQRQWTREYERKRAIPRTCDEREMSKRTACMRMYSHSVCVVCM